MPEDEEKELTDEQTRIVDEMLRREKKSKGFRILSLLVVASLIVISTVLIGLIGMIFSVGFVLLDVVRNYRKEARELLKLRLLYNRAVLEGATVEEMRDVKSLLRFRTEANLENLVDRLETKRRQNGAGV